MGAANLYFESVLTVKIDSFIHATNVDYCSYLQCVFTLCNNEINTMKTASLTQLIKGNSFGAQQSRKAIRNYSYETCLTCRTILKSQPPPLPKVQRC